MYSACNTPPQLAPAHMVSSVDANSKHAYRLSPHSLATLPEILSALSALDEQETQLSRSLEVLISNKASVQLSLDKLKSLAPQLDELQVDAQALAENVSSTAQTARRVGDRVRLLDEEMRRVREAAERVSQVMELKVRMQSLQPGNHC